MGSAMEAVESLRKEVGNFRSLIAEDKISHSEKSITLTKEGPVGVIAFDEPGTKANKLSTPNMLRLFDLLLEVESDSQLGALVLISRKPTIFIAGADIAEISTLSEQGEKALDWLSKLQSVFTFLESLPIPSIAAIHGATMGGGTEMALGCDYRMATDAPETKIGLPEVLLGVLPGWGGTQRLPRLVGLEKSLDMMLTGKTLDGRQAKKIGLVDKLVPKEFLEEKALAWARELAKTRKKRRAPQRDLRTKLLETVPGGKWIVFDMAKKQVLEKTKGNYPAPLKIIEVVKKTYGGSLEKGLKEEAKGFVELVTTPESAALIQVFWLQEKVKKDKGTEVGAAPRAVKKAAVLGAGVMGGGIAQLFAAKNIRVRLKDINWDAITKGYASAHKIFMKRVKRRKMKQSELDNVMALIEGTTTYDGFKSVDLVVEAIVEDLEIKKKVFAETEKHLGEDAILATNTSSLSVTEIAKAARRPERVVGMHFFNPVDKMPLVEVIRGAQSSDEAVATVFHLSKQLGKTPVVVKDGPGFVVNRILGPYLNEAVFLALEGVDPQRIDEIMEKFGMPMGPVALLDEVGLDVAMKVSKILYGAFGQRMKPPAFLETVTDGGRLGKKAGKGIYLYDSDGKRRGIDRSVFEKVQIPARDSSLTDEVVERRMTYLMVNEAARILEEGLVRDKSDIDIAMIFGTGFAPFRGGLLRYADSVGIEPIVSELELYTRKYGERFAPCQYLQSLSVDGKKFYA